MKQPRVSAHSAMSIAAAYEAAVPRRMSNRIRNMAREPTGRTESPAGDARRGSRSTRGPTGLGSHLVRGQRAGRARRFLIGVVGIALTFIVFHARRGLTSARVVWWTLAFLLIWGAFTLVRGEIIGWYPYPFMDPIDKGYAASAVNLTLIGGVFLGLSAGAHWLDGVLARRQPGGVAVSASGV